MHPAVAHVAGLAAARRAEAEARAPGAAAVTPGPGLRITVHFHPDRLLADGSSVAEGLRAAGRWRTQFETGISAGSTTAYPGGDRDRWEQALFGPVYARAVPRDRPAYGGLDVAGHPDGACPRFGSCHLRLRPAVLGRATFTADSRHLAPRDAGTAAEFGPVVAALAEGTSVCGVPMDGPTLLGRLTAAERTVSPRAGRALDDYVEAQVHGGIDLAADVEAVVADPSYRDTPAGDALRGLGPALEWHGGFALGDPGVVPDAFRGRHLRPLLRRIAAQQGRIDAAALGEFAAGAPRDPATLQHLKHAWHALVAYGTWGVR